MNNRQQLLLIALFSAGALFADPTQKKKTPKPSVAKTQSQQQEAPQPNIATPKCQKLKAPKPQGWSFDIGGSYTWMSFSTPPTYSGSTGGVLGKITYQVPDFFFGQARSYYNIGPLSSSVNETSLQESYSEFVGGYCITALKNWTITP